NIVPIAKPDNKDLIEDADPVSASGNVLGNDNLGNTPTQGMEWGTETADYGTISKGPDGEYEYQLDNTKVQNLAMGDTVTEEFTYTITDQDGETSSSTLTITITGTNDQPTITNGVDAEGVIDSRELTEQTDDSVITQS
ncbi:VCBS domain-containing protein, partial [Psychrobacter sp. Rd 27.2]|uniref:VCBS domain-containing protein n=1 Tax=Psychrobacter sp. Rd 27.2 TaxID=1926479 RepID=UPI00096554F0